MSAVAVLGSEEAGAVLGEGSTTSTTSGIDEVGSDEVGSDEEVADIVEEAAADNSGSDFGFSLEDGECYSPALHHSARLPLPPPKATRSQETAHLTPSKPTA